MVHFCLAWDLLANIVKADTNVGGVSESNGVGGISVRVGTSGGKDLGLSLGFPPLAAIVKTCAKKDIDQRQVQGV